MFLGRQNILERLSKGDLVIDPLPTEEQFSTFAVDLRLGTQFLQVPLARHPGFGIEAPIAVPSSPKESPKEISIGSYFTLNPATTVMATTVEYVRMPEDLAGFLSPRLAWERLGLSVGTGVIDPHFWGKLTMVLWNNTSIPIRLYPGVPIIRLCFAQVSGGKKDTAETIESSSEIEMLKIRRENVAPHSSLDPTLMSLLMNRLANLSSATGPHKGKILEEFIAELFTSVEGLRILKCNARLSAEELDLIISNNLNTGFWRLAGSPLVIECKNWSSKVGAREISVLIDKLQAISPDAKTGILVALNGITGDSYSDAMLKIREARQRGRYVLVLEYKDLAEALSSSSLTHVIERKYEAVLLI